MKKFFMFAALAVAVGFTSCQKDGNDNEAGDPVNLRIKLTNDVFTGTRTLDDLTGLKQTAVNMKGDDPVYVYVFNGSGKLLMSDLLSNVTALQAGKTYTNELNSKLTTAAKKVVVLGNLASAPTEVKVYEDLQYQIETLTAAQTRFDDGSKVGTITVYGEGGITWGTPVGGVAQGETTLDLNPLLSRIDVSVAFGNEAKGILTAVPTDGTTGVIFRGVATLYSGSASHYAVKFPYTYAQASAASDKALNSALIADNYNLWNTVGHGDASALAGHFLNGVWDAPAKTGTFAKSFYAFPPTNETHPTTNTDSKLYGYKAHTIVTVYGDYYDKDGNKTTLFWPVHFDGVEVVENSKTVPFLEQGRHYTLGITLNADFTDGNGGGTDPEKEHPADVKITIKEAQWKSTIALDKIFS